MALAHTASALTVRRRVDPTSPVRYSAPAKPAGHWTWDGGAPVTVGYGDSVESIARKYGVPAHAILQTNGIANAAQVRPGQRLVIPRYVTSSVAAHSVAPRVAAPVQAPTHVASAAAAAGNVHTVAPGESLIGIARRYHMSLIGFGACQQDFAFH